MHPFTHRLALAAALGLLAVPAAASADSIVYVDGGNVWSAKPDGSAKVQLTDGGNWHSPTQADDGTIAAVQGSGPIRVMARDGRPLRSITTPPAPSGDGGSFAPRPVQLSFSPDGSKLAYAYTGMSCPVASSCGTIQRSTFYTRADVTEATPHAEWGNQFGVSNPEWITNDRALVFGGSGAQVSIDDLGGGDYSYAKWMTPDADQGDGELSRDGTRLATTFFYGKDTMLAFFSVSGDPRTGAPPGQPVVSCATDTRDERYADPSWSPDGSALAFESSAGLETMRFSRYEPGDCAADGSTVLSPTGSSPDWGPADPPAARWTPAAPAAAPSPAPAPTPSGGPAAAALRIDAGGRARQAFKRTLRVTCAAPVAGTCTATAKVKAGGKTYRAKASRAVAAGRATTLTLRFAAGDAKRIRKAARRKAVKATVVLTVAGAGGATGTARRTVRLG